ncbi:MAG: nucleoside hydrolase [Chloroflexota bacterium]
MPKKIIIDTDPGIDDAMAILFAFNAPEIEVVGLTAVFGNVHVDLTTQNALRLVELAGRPHLPVAQGAAKPLATPLMHIADFVHGADGFGNTNQPPPTIEAVDKTAVQFIIETIMDNPGEITLVPIGPLTNIALALALEPRIAQNVAEVVLMGGAATVSGNVTPAAEANIISDPHAADVVFTTDWPLTMVGLDVTNKAVMDAAYLNNLKASGTKYCDFIYDISHFYRQFHLDRYGIDEIAVHDASAIAYLIDPTLFTTQKGSVRVVVDGIACGQTLMDRIGGWDSPNPWTEQPQVNVCVDVEGKRLIELYERYMFGS